MEEQMRSKNPSRATPANLMKAELDKLTTTRAKPCLMKTSWTGRTARIEDLQLNSARIQERVTIANLMRYRNVKIRVTATNTTQTNSFPTKCIKCTMSIWRRKSAYATKSKPCNEKRASLKISIVMKLHICFRKNMIMISKQTKKCSTWNSNQIKTRHRIGWEICHQKAEKLISVREVRNWCWMKNKRKKLLLILQTTTTANKK